MAPCKIWISTGIALTDDCRLHLKIEEKLFSRTGTHWMWPSMWCFLNIKWYEFRDFVSNPRTFWVLMRLALFEGVFKTFENSPKFMGWSIKRTTTRHHFHFHLEFLLNFWKMKFVYLKFWRIIISGILLGKALSFFDAYWLSLGYGVLFLIGYCTQWTSQFMVVVFVPHSSRRTVIWSWRNARS